MTLSQKQHDFAQQKIKRLGLEDQITIELRDYSTLEGTYDKIASIGMFEHIGIANMEKYFQDGIYIKLFKTDLQEPFLKKRSFIQNK